jgi:hypothetical protein
MVTNFTTLDSFALQRHGCNGLCGAPYYMVAICLSTSENRQKYHALMRIGVFFKKVGFAPWEMLDIVDGLAHDTWHEMKLATINFNSKVMCCAKCVSRDVLECFLKKTAAWKN